MFNPVATYRLQFNQTFTFTHLESLIAYLQQLGVSTIYAAPVFEAAPGSTHGYDGVNPHRINPEIGTEEQLTQISAALKAQNMGWLQDIVPNHMGYHFNNPWLTDVLEKGRLSAYADYFDAAWASDLFNEERIMAPFLGSALNRVIEGGELTIIYQGNQLLFKYYDNTWPLHPKSYQRVLGAVKSKNQQLQPLLHELATLLASAAADFGPRWDDFKQTLNTFAAGRAGKDSLNRCLAAVNNSTDAIEDIAKEQVYRLCSYEETDQHINYRRFFTVNSLICLNIQHQQVFDDFHQYVRKLTGAGIFQGLRIDHIDGLYNPGRYLGRLRDLAGEETYIVAEKILEKGEHMPQQWPVQGSTGYDFLALVNNLFTSRSAGKPFTQFYEQLVNSHAAVHEQILQKKAYILTGHMGGELDNLSRLFVKLRLAGRKSLNQVSGQALKEAIAQVLIYCPVYRYYADQMPLQADDEQALKNILQQAEHTHKELTAAFTLLREALIHKPQHAPADYCGRALTFYRRLMQFTGPLMAKGVEDTLMYTWNRFIGHNEVGDAPDAFGISKKKFHRQMKRRQKRWPLTINGTSTHDTKRGEDVRARLNVLTDIHQEWLQTVQHWQQLNAGLKQENVPDANDEYFIYQTLTGVYAMPGQDEDELDKRLPEYLTKALREAKVNTNWASPDEPYETGVLSFASALLKKETAFWSSFKQFQQRIADYGIINSLAQVLLKFTCPGVPDVYQGCELWDLSLVDPDNRRPVDYAHRAGLLQQLEASSQSAANLINDLWASRYTGSIKFWLTRLLFQERKQAADVYSKGHYIPLKVKGIYKKHIIAFARRYHTQWYITVAPLHLAGLAGSLDTSPALIDWKDTCIVLPDDAPTDWQHRLFNTSGNHNGEILISEIFGSLPLALLRLEHKPNKRRAGVLMHITSLPSAYGIGDIGPQAYRFAGFLSKSGQHLWQLLPLNPVSADELYSPYSSACSMAGNTLLISPDMLADEGLLAADDLKPFRRPAGSQTDYETAVTIKNDLFDIAYSNYLTNCTPAMHQRFGQFCDRENYWLHDFALYTLLRQQYSQPWYQWPDEFRLRRPAALSRLAKTRRHELDKIKWLQFVFIQQWHRLKAHCHSLNIQLLGDLPFYVSYDSSDVWANSAIFRLNRQGNMAGIAGVPPDYFNADGQLWGMPVYRWDILKSNGYRWWINRLGKNMELFDRLRLDHFRAFADYWEVPAGETTARNGEWKLGPGSDFFKKVQEALGELPFIAEDLGDINPGVTRLRDEFNLPGMKVLQFAFGDAMPASDYIPHHHQENFVVYTGTHDNNTTLGWYRQDIDTPVKKQIRQYTGIKASAKNINKVLGRMAYASTADTVILPLQDILGLDETARMNNPASAKNNWLWRLPAKRLSNKYKKQLLRWAKLYHRV